MAQIPKRSAQSVFGDNILADIASLLGFEEPAAADLLSPIGAIKIPAGKYLLPRTGKAVALDPLQHHDKIAQRTFGQTLEEFMQAGGIRGREQGIEIGVDAKGNPTAPLDHVKAALENAVSQVLSKSDPVIDTVYLDFNRGAPGQVSRSRIYEIEDLIEADFDPFKARPQHSFPD